MMMDRGPLHVASGAATTPPGLLDSSNVVRTAGPGSVNAIGPALQEPPNIAGQSGRQEMLNAILRTGPATVVSASGSGGPARAGAVVGGITMVADEVFPVDSSFVLPALVTVGAVSISSRTGANTGALQTPNDGAVPPLITGAMPVTLQGPKGGYLYARILEAGNLDALELPGVCCDPLSGICPGLFLPSCGTRSPAQLRVQFACASLERATSMSSPAALDPETSKAVFQQELLMKSLNFCSVDTFTVKLQCKSLTLLEATMPLRVALPTPLASGLPPQELGAHSKSLHAVEEAASHPVPPHSWLPVQRVFLQKPGSARLVSGTSPPSVVSSRMEPYLDLQLLQLVDGSLPRIEGTSPLMLAIENRQDQLVRAYLSLNVAETLPLDEQAACVTAAIQRHYLEVLVLLLDRIMPLHEHLLLAIQLHAEDIVEALLQAGGAPLLHSHPRSTRRATSPRRGGIPRLRQEHAAADSKNSLSGTSSSASSRPQLTPLSLACSLGDVATVDAICQWARRERVHVDPTAPTVLSGETTMSLVGGRGGDTSNNSGVARWWDQEDRDHTGQNDGSGGGTNYGDPPMIMAVRGCGSVTAKLCLINTLAHFGFSSDARSPVDSWTPLLAAVELGSLELTAALINVGARLSAERQLGFTPLHLACQMAQWHLVPILTESMCGQYNRVAAWGPSPQYVSVNLADSYGRTALDIALLHYFSNPIPNVSDFSGESSSSGNERRKAVDILREFVHRTAPEDPGIVCGWELLGVLRFLDALPSKKAVGAQFFAEWTSDKACPTEKSPVKVPEWRAPQGAPYGDLEELLQAVRVLVRAGGQTKHLLPDLLQPPERGQSLESQNGDFKDCVREPSGGHMRPDAACKYSLLDVDDLSEVSMDDSAAIRSA